MINKPRVLETRLYIQMSILNELYIIIIRKATLYIIIIIRIFIVELI